MCGQRICQSHPKLLGIGAVRRNLEASEAGRKTSSFSAAWKCPHEETSQSCILIIYSTAKVLALRLKLN